MCYTILGGSVKKIRYDRILIAIVILILVIFNIGLGLFVFETRKIDNNNTIKEIVVESGSSASSVIEMLKNENLIRSVFFSKVYVKLNNLSFQAGTYDISTSMNTREILKNIANGKVTNKYNIKLTFKEGENINDYVKIISENTNNTSSSVYNLLKDSEYIDTLIEKYWFLTDDIKQSEIYYPLEGYLFPETYIFENKDVTVKEIFATMLNQTDKVLSRYREEIIEKNLNVHEFLTLASIVELEGLYENDRKEIAGVFYNRLNSGWSLGSDVTTYYAVQKDMGEYPEIWQAWIDYKSPYNTRLPEMAGKLPIGPIGNPGIISIEASINPTKTENYYFVANCKTGKTEFSKTYEEHSIKVNNILASGCKF